MNRFYRVVLFVSLLIGLSGAPSVTLRAAPDKIAPWVLAHTADGAETEFLVVLAAQADLSGAARLQTKAEKGLYVYETLWRTAQTSQAPLLKWLKARGVEYRPYYIVNLIWVKGDASLAQALAARPDVARIEGNPRIQNVLPQPARPFDALLAAAPTAVEPNIAYVRAPEVWAMGFTGQDIVVGGQDTGYEWTHPALRPHYRGWNGTTANHDYNWHDAIHSGGGSCGPDSLVPCDDYSHGTHTMGTVVGDDGGTNQIGMAPGAQWIGCRNMDVGYGTPATYLECFEFFLAPYPVGGKPAQGDPGKAPDVTNNSWTCPPNEGCSWNTLQSAVEAQRAAGILTVVSAGNAGCPQLNCTTISDPPALYAAAYTVGALNTGTDTIASLSGCGPVMVDGSNRRKPDLTAPGTNVRSCVLNGAYGTKSGTSMAAPHVSASLALVRSINPLATAASVISLLSSTGTNVPKPPGVFPVGNYKMPSLLTAVNQAIANGYTWPAFAMVTNTSQWNRFTTAAPQMARAAIAGTMLPTLIAPVSPVYYVPDPNAPLVSGYAAFPDSTSQPRAYFKVYTKLKASQTTLKPLYRLSKLQNVGNGRDECGNLMPVPTKPIPVIHTYTTSKTTRNQLMGSGAGQCYKYDGVEGYVAPSNLGGLQELFQLYNPTADSYILVPSSKVSLANGIGYAQNQTSLGWVVPN